MVFREKTRVSPYFIQICLHLVYPVIRLYFSDADDAGLC